MSNVTDNLHHDDNSLQSLRACCMLISQNVRREHAQSMHCNVSDVMPSMSRTDIQTGSCIHAAGCCRKYCDVDMLMMCIQLSDAMPRMGYKLTIIRALHTSASCCRKYCDVDDHWVTSAVRIVTFGWVVGECRSQAL
jgi:hypothetical protein